MKFFSSLRCIYCLVKCSKYLYYIKKAVCLAAIIMTAVSALCLLSGESSTVKRIREMF